ncbi:hypothetical protein EON77_05715 [bacterium]|nr:MAG: hypothetical protein EON77_05715 [bacterium]
MNAFAIARNGPDTIDGKRSPASTASLNASSGVDTITRAFDLNRARTTPSALAGESTPASFRAAMDAVAAARKTSDAGPESPKDAKLRETAETLVNQFFMGTMLKQMRSSPFKDQTFSGGKAGAAYAGLFDQHLSAKAGGGMGKGLVDVMVKHLKGDRGAAAPVDLSRVQAEYRRDDRKQKEPSDAAPAVDRAA